MAGRYGTAAAGGRTLSDPCDLPLCSGGDAEAWWAASKIWRSTLLGLVIASKKKVPQSDWPLGLQAGLGAAESAAAIFGDEFELPWFVFQSQIEQYAAAQQTMRDYAGDLADFLESQGVKVGKPPADAPPSGFGPALDSLIKIAGFGIAAYVAVNMLKASKG